MENTPDINKIKGAMAASAIGGALGRPDGLITSSTQMALFTAEGLILSTIRSDYKDLEDATEPVFHALLRWLTTQQMFMMGDLVKSFGTCAIQDGILMGHQELFALRNPSDTCLKALQEPRMGTLEHPLNTADGPGALVRTLPVGLAFSDASTAFDMGCKTAAITHGHPEAIFSSGVFAAILSQILAGQPFSWAVTGAVNLLKSQPGHEAVLHLLEAALTLSGSKEPTPEAIDAHFNEKTAAHILGAAVYCCLCHPKDMNRGLLLSVDHSGNIDEIGAATGAFLGALEGIDTIPDQFLDNLELKNLILETATDLFDRFHKEQPNL